MLTIVINVTVILLAANTVEALGSRAGRCPDPLEIVIEAGDTGYEVKTQKLF